MAAKRFQTPFAISSLTPRQVHQMQGRGFVGLRIQDDGYEILVDTTHVEAVSCEEIYICDQDRRGFQLTIRLTHQRGKQIFHWREDGVLHSAYWIPENEPVEVYDEADTDSIRFAHYNPAASLVGES